jgi:hypothetical protein
MLKSAKAGVAVGDAMRHVATHQDCANEATTTRHYNSASLTQVVPFAFEYCMCAAQSLHRKLSLSDRKGRFGLARRESSQMDGGTSGARRIGAGADQRFPAPALPGAGQQ